MPNLDFPNNLIRDIYDTTERLDQKIQQVHIPNLMETLNYLPENERNGILRRYQDGLTFRKVGEAIGQQSTIAQQTVKRGIKRLRRFGDHRYFQVDPDTGTAHMPDVANRYIGELTLHTGAETALVKAGYQTIESVRALSEAQVKEIPNFGERYFADFAEKIAQYEERNGLTPYPKTSYPNNLMQAIFGEKHKATLDEIQAVENAIDELNRQQQSLLLMKYKDGLTMRDIAEKIQLSDYRTSQTIQRGIEKIKQRIQPKYDATNGTPDKQNKTSRSHQALHQTYPFNLISKIMGADEAYLRTAYLEGFHQEIERLPDTFRTFVRLRFELGLTLSICGHRMNKRPYEIELLERRLFEKLRAKKQEGHLTAISKHHLTAVQQQNCEIMNENQHLKKLLQEVQSGECQLDNIQPPQNKIDAPLAKYGLTFKDEGQTE